MSKIVRQKVIAGMTDSEDLDKNASVAVDTVPVFRIVIVLLTFAEH